MPQVCSPGACWETPAMLIILVWYLYMFIFAVDCVDQCTHICMSCFSLFGLQAYSQAISGLELWYPDPRGCLMMSLSGNWENVASKVQWRTPYVYPVIWAVPVWTRGWFLARFATSNIYSVKNIHPSCECITHTQPGKPGIWWSGFSSWHLWSYESDQIFTVSRQ